MTSSQIAPMPQTRLQQLIELVEVADLPLFAPLATPQDLSTRNAVDVLQRGVYHGVRSCSEIGLEARASWIDAETGLPETGKIQITYTPDGARLRRDALQIALLLFRSRAATPQDLAAILHGILRLLLGPSALAVTVTPDSRGGVTEKGKVKWKADAERLDTVFSPEEELTRVVLDLSVPRRIEELRRRGGPSKENVALAEKGLVEILDSKSWKGSGDQRDALVYALAVCAFRPEGSRCFGLTFHAGEDGLGVEPGDLRAVEDAELVEETQTDVEDWLVEVMRGENPGPLRVTFGAGQAAPVAVERVADLEALEASGAAELEEVQAEDGAKLLEVSGPVYDGNHAAELESAYWIDLMRSVVGQYGCTLDREAGRSARCADHFEHFDIHNGAGEIALRLCLDGADWYLLDGQKRTPTDALKIAGRLMKLDKEAKAVPAPAAPPELPGEGVMKRGGGGVVRLVESYGFRLEEDPADPGAMTVHPKRKGSKSVGKIGFDDAGRLVELAWEADWSRQTIVDLSGINERRLEHWLLVGEGAYKGRNR